MAAQKPEVCMQAVCCHLWLRSYLEFYRAHSNKIPTAIHILRVQLFNGVVSDVTENIQEIDMDAAQTRCNTISAQTSNAYIYIFDVARFNDIVANTTESRVIPEIHMAAIHAN